MESVEEVSKEFAAVEATSQTTSHDDDLVDDPPTASPPHPKRRKTAKRATVEPSLVLSLMRLDPLLQFLTRATGRPLVPLATLKAALPGGPSANPLLLQHIPELEQRGVLQLTGRPMMDLRHVSWDDTDVSVGFPPPPSPIDATNPDGTTDKLHGSTKAAGKRRLAALKRSLKKQPGSVTAQPRDIPKIEDGFERDTEGNKRWDLPQTAEDSDDDQLQDTVVLEEEKEGREALHSLFKFKTLTRAQAKAIKSHSKFSVEYVLPKQASYVGSKAPRTSSYGSLSSETLAKLPLSLSDALSIERGPGPSGTIGYSRKKLYSHQVTAIEAAMNGEHTLVCTGTGSGKSLCFLLPVLAVAMGDDTDSTSLIMFPTKALAQDQMTKLSKVVHSDTELSARLRPGIIDGDVSHPERSEIAKTCNIILTNPDTLHAAILPGWKGMYKRLLGCVRYVVIDEAHMYDGVFGAHVAMVLSRLIRLCSVCAGMRPRQSQHRLLQKQEGRPTFLACSATMSHPEHHFRLLIPIPKQAVVRVITPEDDGSPRAAKHFFVWNPPLMDLNGASLGQVNVPKTTSDLKKSNTTVSKQPSKFYDTEGVGVVGNPDCLEASENLLKRTGGNQVHSHQLYRRHSAEETALLLARAIANNVRCIAFCKTRSLVEWVYERCIQSLKADPSTEKLTNKVEPYRGGYTAEVRRSIERQLFHNELIAVIGTSALELGVDVGGIDLTLHCGYPSSHASLLQQAGRAGRGAARLHVPSLSIMVCFNSPAEQHIWRNPKNLLARGLTAPISMPVNAGLVRGHLLCAGAEYALTAQHKVTTLFQVADGEGCCQLSDHDLFGSKEVYQEAMDSLLSTGLMKEESVSVSSATIASVDTFKTHPFVEKPWTKVNLRSIEPVQYSIVDLSHPLQGGQMTGVKNEKAVMDTIPYSRVFYHAFPGAIITHRGRRYKVQSMTRPPAFAHDSSGYRGGEQLAAYAKPTSARYATRPLSTMNITVVKQLERVDVQRGTLRAADKCERPHHPWEVYPTEEAQLGGCLAGNGALTVRRNVHGYKKLSLITRKELSRAEISLPPMEFDTYGFWIDTDATVLKHSVSRYDEGVHALSHAILAVAPLFVPCADSDLNCDHSYHGCTRVVIFDMRAGGSGSCAQLWKFLFVPDGLMDAVIELLEDCSTCKYDRGYDGGCPACLHYSQCLKFNQNLSKSAALIIARHILARVKKTQLYKTNETAANSSPVQSPLRKKKSAGFGSPRRAARARALRRAADLQPARERQIVVGRAPWPVDQSNGLARAQVEAD